MESDPIGLMGGVNSYLYVGANSLNLIDFDGLAAWRVTGSWGAQEIQAYSDFMRTFISSYNQRIDCADLGLLGLIQFASQNGLPVNL